VNLWYKGEIHRLKNAAYPNCLWHKMNCPKPAIRAHAKPSVYESFTTPQIEAITRCFLANAAQNCQEWDDPKLYLFKPKS
jgi:hypothetical protein